MLVDLLILTLIWALLGALVGWLAHAARWGLGAYGLGDRASWMVDGRIGRWSGVCRGRAGLGFFFVRFSSTPNALWVSALAVTLGPGSSPACAALAPLILMVLLECDQ